MIIVNFMGGLGNQMFQYALYKELQALGKTVYADKILFYKKIENREFALDIFGIKLQEASNYDCVRLRGEQSKLLDMIKRKYSLIKTYYREKAIKYNAEIKEMDEMYLDGYWQSEQYFCDITEKVREDFKFPELTDEHMKKYVEKMRRENSVSLHVRRGDYLNNEKMYGGICTEIYYQEAIRTIKQYIQNPQFYVFSDDIEWAKKQFAGEEFQFVEKSQNAKDYIDMQLMSLCKHNIIANSSFSWWGAWLNSNNHKIVVAPKKWLNGTEVKDVWCDGWVNI